MKEINVYTLFNIDEIYSFLNDKLENYLFQYCYKILRINLVDEFIQINISEK